MQGEGGEAVVQSWTRLFARELLCSAVAVEVGKKREKKSSYWQDRTCSAARCRPYQKLQVKENVAGPRLMLLNCCPVGGTLQPYSSSQLKGVSRVGTSFN